MAVSELAADPVEAAAALVASHEDDPGWLDRFVLALVSERGRGLAYVLQAWDLSPAQAAKIFGVSRQALNKWLVQGVPSARAAAVADLEAATDLLVRYLKPGRIPAVVRRKAARFGDRSLIEIAIEGGTHEVLSACRAMFDFAQANAPAV